MAEFPREVIECMADHYILLCLTEIDRLTALLADRDAEIARLKRYVGVMDATMKIEDKPSVEVKR